VSRISWTDFVFLRTSKLGAGLHCFTPLAHQADLSKVPKEKFADVFATYEQAGAGHEGSVCFTDHYSQQPLTPKFIMDLKRSKETDRPKYCCNAPPSPRWTPAWGQGQHGHTALSSVNRGEVRHCVDQHQEADLRAPHRCPLQN